MSAKCSAVSEKSSSSVSDTCAVASMSSIDQYEILVNVLLQPESSQEKDVMSTPNIARNIILSDK